MGQTPANFLNLDWSMAKKTPTASTIVESSFSDNGLRIDREAGVIRDVMILGRESANGRIYSEDALEDAARLYEGRSVNLDHPSGDPRQVRSVSDQWGVLENVRVAKSGVRGDLSYLKEHSQTPVLLERAERFPKNFGLSHNAQGTVRPGGSGKPDQVESIEFVESVDVVSRPATTRGLFEHETGGPDVADKKTKTVGEILEGKRGREAKRLRSLLEMDEMAAMGAEDVEVSMDDASTPEDEMAASVEALVLSVLRDDKSDATGKVAKIRQILGVADKLKDGGDSGDSGDSESSSEGEPMEESAKLRALLLKDHARDILEETGHVLADLTSAQRKILRRAQSTDEVEELVESWNLPEKSSGPSDTSQLNRPRAIGQRQATPQNVQEGLDPGRASYEDLKKQAMVGARRS